MVSLSSQMFTAVDPGGAAELQLDNTVVPGCFHRSLRLLQREAVSLGCRLVSVWIRRGGLLLSEVPSRWSLSVLLFVRLWSVAQHEDWFSFLGFVMSDTAGDVLIEPQTPKRLVCIRLYGRQQEAKSSSGVSVLILRAITWDKIRTCRSTLLFRTLLKCNLS